MSSAPGQLHESAVRLDPPPPVRPESQDGGPDRRRGVTWLVLALAVGVAVPTLLAAVTGNLPIPHNDGWAYSRIARTFGLTGHIRLLNWNAPALYGQFVELGPLARSLVVQQVFVALLAVLGLLCAYDLLRPRIGARPAVFAVLLTALWPGFGLLATSSMSDVPAFAAAFLTLALGRRALERDSRLLFALACAAGFWGVTIRIQDIVAPASVLIYAYFSRRSRSRIGLGTLAIGTVVLGAACLVFNKWQTSLPRSQAPTYSLVANIIGADVTSAVRCFFTLALSLSPAVVLVARPWRWRLASQLTGAGTGLVGVLALHDYHAVGFFLGNYLSPSGAYSAVLVDGSNLHVIPTTLWRLLVVVALASGALLAGLLVEKARGADPLLSVFTVLTAAVTLATTATGQIVFDRFLFPLLPGCLAILLARRASQETAEAAEPAEPTGAAEPEPVTSARPRLRTLRRGWGWGRGRGRGWGTIAAAALTLGLTALSFALLTSSLGLDVQRWRLGTELAAQGVPADRIDAGFEWMGYHSAHGVIKRNPDSIVDHWQMFFTQAPCSVVTAGLTEPGWTLRKQVSYSTFLVAGTTRLYVYDTHAAGCS